VLEISSAAAEAVKALEGHDGARLRISIAATTEQGTALQVTMTDQPGPDDQSIKTEDGAEVLVEPAAALYLTDKVLDARKNVDGTIQFLFHGKV
jgi:iron-sulfur cluster assembly protein